MKVVIVGGGISGLAAAYYLVKAGISPTLIERRPRLGGVIQTETQQGCTVELGPDSYLAVKPAATELINEVGLGGSLIGSNDHERVTFILRDGRLVALPDGLMMMVPTKIAPLIRTPLLGWRAKLRMGVEYLRKPSNIPQPDRSVAEFITDHYGREALEYLAEPLLSGVYGGDPAKLSAPGVLPRFVELESKYGSVTRGVLAERAASTSSQISGSLFKTLKGGLASLVAELEHRIAGSARVIHGEAVGLREGQVQVGGDWLEADHVVLACPAHEAAALLEDVAPKLARLLRQVEYTSSLTLSLGYDKAALGAEPCGFGLLVPKKERQRLVACTWVQNKFPHRAPAGMALLRCFFGGAGDETVLTESDEEILAIAKDEVRRILDIRADPSFHVIARWPKSMAQYTVGHQARLKEIEGRTAATPWLHLAGNAYGGIGIPDCIRSGRDAARCVVSRNCQRDLLSS